MELLRLATGSHKKGSGMGCGMNVVSWEMGDKVITHSPPTADKMLAKIVQKVNDTICAEKEGRLLCPSCSVKVLELAHRTVGTNLKAYGFSDEQIRHVWVEIALAEARSAEHLSKPGEAKRCNDVVQRWLDGDATTEEVRSSAPAFYLPAFYAAVATTAFYAAPTAVAAAFYAAAADNVDNALQRAHALIDRFEKITGIKSARVSEKTAQKAIDKMLAKA